jgi:hypothetical protein
MSLFIMQEHAGFQASKPGCDIVHNAVDNLVKVEYRSDGLRDLLHTLEFFDKIVGHRSNCEFVTGETGYRSHSDLSLWELDHTRNTVKG